MTNKEGYTARIVGRTVGENLEGAIDCSLDNGETWTAVERTPFELDNVTQIMFRCNHGGGCVAYRYTGADMIRAGRGASIEKYGRQLEFDKNRTLTQNTSFRFFVERETTYENNDI